MSIKVETLHKVHHNGRRGKPLWVHLQVTLRPRSFTFCIEGWYGPDGGWYWVRRWTYLGRVHRFTYRRRSPSAPRRRAR